MSQKPKTIKVTVDKSHLLTLGEKMYVESIELLRELVNNAYDADATEVNVTVSPDKIIVEDNGAGMNESPDYKKMVRSRLHEIEDEIEYLET